MASRYEQAYSDEWFCVPRNGIDIACCDCSLVHRVKSRIRDNHIEVQFAQNKRSTGALRRSSKKKQKGSIKQFSHRASMEHLYE